MTEHTPTIIKRCINCGTEIPNSEYICRTCYEKVVNDEALNSAPQEGKFYCADENSASCGNRCNNQCHSCEEAQLKTFSYAPQVNESQEELWKELFDSPILFMEDEVQHAMKKFTITRNP